MRCAVCIAGVFKLACVHRGLQALVVSVNTLLQLLLHYTLPTAVFVVLVHH